MNKENIMTTKTKNRLESNGTKAAQLITALRKPVYYMQRSRSTFDPEKYMKDLRAFQSLLHKTKS